MVLRAGDQTLCCRAADLRRVGGYDSRWVIMEDTDMCVRMHEAGPTAAAAAPTAMATHINCEMDRGSSTHGRSSRRGGGNGKDKGSSSSSVTVCQGGVCSRVSPPDETCVDDGGSGVPTTTTSSSSSSSSRAPWEALCSYLQWWCCPRGRVVQVLDRVNVTSGRRLASWGNWKGTAIHVAMGVNWYFGKDPQQLYELYHRLYTDNYR